MRNILTFIIAILPFIGYFWGRRNGKQDLKNEQNEANIKNVKESRAAENDIENYADDELINFIDELQKSNRD